MLEGMFETLFEPLVRGRGWGKGQILLGTEHDLCGRAYSLSLAVLLGSLSRASACLAWLPYGRQGLEGGDCVEGPLGSPFLASSWGSLQGFSWQAWSWRT